MYRLTLIAQPINSCLKHTKSFHTLSSELVFRTGHCSFVSSLISVGASTLVSLGWDSRLLFWRGIEPIKRTHGEVFPIEDSDPHCGFKLGASATTEFLPLSMREALGFGVLVLLTDRTRDVHLTYYTFLPMP